MFSFNFQFSCKTGAISRFKTEVGGKFISPYQRKGCYAKGVKLAISKWKIVEEQSLKKNTLLYKTISV